jgi:hypothetical protein
VVSAIAIHKRPKAELLRSHPDKFPGRWRARLAACDVELVMMRVKEMSQKNLMGGVKPAEWLFI